MFLVLGLAASGQEMIEFRVNLAGYHPDMPKRALLMSTAELQDPKVLVKRENGDTVCALRAAPEANAWPPFAYCYALDLADLREQGRYFLELEGPSLRSPVFELGPYPAWQEDVVGFIRSQRCGYNPNIKAYCHQKDGLSFFGMRPDSTHIDATGGWHDAADQLKYLITGSNTTARMLMAYQLDPSGFSDRFDARGLPGANGLPDVLDEAKWGLEWILKLHPGPGELYHQVADDRDHRGFKMPDADNADYGWGANGFRPVYFADGKPQGLSQYKSKATGIANLAGRSAATLALGYEVFRAFGSEEGFASKCLEAALELYAMGRKQEGYQQGNSYGAPYRYEESTWADDMEWAAAKLYGVTGEEKFLHEARQYAEQIGTWSWMERDSAGHYEMYPFVNMGHYALWQFGNEADRKQAAAWYAHNLDRVATRAGQNPYKAGQLFIWCSNNLAAAVATQALLYEEMTGSRKYRSLLQDHVNWLLGLNPWGTSMITEIPEGADTPSDVHMPFWRLKQQAIKGSLVDGPLWASIHGRMLGIALSEPDAYARLQPGHLVYHDDYMDYSTNEPTLDGSAELLHILTYMSRHQKPD